MTDEQLVEAVDYWFGQDSDQLPADERAVQLAAMNLATERFADTHRTGAKARVWLVREDAFVLITQKNRLKATLAQAQKDDATQEQLEAMESRLRTLEQQVKEVKSFCKAAEQNLRDVTIKGLAGQ